MNWRAVGREVWEEHPDGNFHICTCHKLDDGEENARLIADTHNTKEEIDAFGEAIAELEEKLSRALSSSGKG